MCKISVLMSTYNESEKELNECYIKYRGKEQTYKENAEEYCAFSEKMKLIHYTPPIMVVQPFIKPSIYFMQKAIECLGFARFFTMKSALLLDTDYNIRWSQGYIPQYLFRCIYLIKHYLFFSSIDSVWLILNCLVN